MKKILNKINLKLKNKKNNKIIQTNMVNKVDIQKNIQKKNKMQIWNIY